MKKYEKIMNVFTVAIAQLETLEACNITKAAKLETKKNIILAEAESKAFAIVNRAEELYKESAAAVNTLKKLNDLLS